MVKAFGLVVLLLTLTGCSSGGAPRSYEVTPCTSSPGSYECQVERYQRLP